MVTKLPRTHLTHTPPIQRALAKATARWPEARSDSQRLAKIASEWSQLEPCVADAGTAATAGKYRGVFGPEYLADLRAEWPDS